MDWVSSMTYQVKQRVFDLTEGFGTVYDIAVDLAVRFDNGNMLLYNKDGRVLRDDKHPSLLTTDDAAKLGHIDTTTKGDFK